MMKMILLAWALFSGALAWAQPVEPQGDPEIWRHHLKTDLLPFWRRVADRAAVDGSFPGNLCQDGSIPVDGCDGVPRFRARNPQQTLTGQSRQIYAYAVAFHMTGDTAYLDLAKAGTSYLFRTFLDPETGLFFEVYDVKRGTHQGRYDAQQQAYGLLGPSFLYYLTGDETLYRQIADVDAAIQKRLRLGQSGAYRETADADGPAEAITKHLDQLNAYKVLLAGAAPLSDRANHVADAHVIARHLRQAYLDPITGLIKPNTSVADGGLKADYGHAIKTFWFLDQAAKLAGDRDLEMFAQQGAKALLLQAFQADHNSFVTDRRDDGSIEAKAHWWGYAELNQYGVSLAVSDPSLRPLLSATQRFWLENFIDHSFQGSWNAVDIISRIPDQKTPKHWQWKAGYHDYEHALINYLAVAGIRGEAIELYFARSDPKQVGLLYGFKADMDIVEKAAESPAPVGTEAEGIKAGVIKAKISNIHF